MRNRAEQILRIACLVLAALLLYQLAGVCLRINPLRGVIVPALPSLTVGTNSPADAGRGADLATSAILKGTSRQSPPESSASSMLLRAKGTNSPVHELLAKTESNVVASLELKSSGTNSTATTNNLASGTNVLVAANAAETNSVRRPKPEKRSAGSGLPPEMAGMNMSPMSALGKRGADLPPDIQARISRITESEILGPVMRPLPMALLGIAGEFAILRSASGQTGLVKEGDSLGELKLLKIGVNRVLIEQDGQKKELTIFSGYGGESLLPKQKETPDEITLQ